jgi:hypothetical protein
MADNNTAGSNGQGDTPVSAVQRVQNYSPVVQASEKAHQYYSMAKEMNPHVKSGLDFAESKLASLSAVIWYVHFVPVCTCELADVYECGSMVYLGAIWTFCNCSILS